MWLEIEGVKGEEIRFAVYLDDGKVRHEFQTRGGAESFMKAMEDGDY